MDERWRFLMNGDEATVAANIAALEPDVGVPIADIAAAHVELSQELVRALGERPTASDLLIVGLSNHALNLFIEVLSMGCRGLFDLAPYLFRPLFDVVGLVYGLGTDEKAAGRFAAKGITEKGTPKASDGRKAFVAALKEGGSQHPGLMDNALSIEKRWVEHAHLLNDSGAHTSIAHLDKIFLRTAKGLSPSAGGLADPHQFRLLIGAATESECEVMLAIWFVRYPKLSASWPARIGELLTLARAKLA